MTEHARSTPASRALSLALVLLLALMQLPAGSHTPAATQLFAALLAALGAVAALLIVTGRIPAPRLDGVQRTLLLIWLLWLGWIALQLLPLPSDWLASLAPASLQAWQRAAAYLPEAPPLRISLSPADTRWMLWLSTAYGLLYYLVLCCVRTPSNRRILLYGLIAAATAQALFGGLMVASGLELGPFGHKQHYLGSATGTFINRNHFAGCLEIGGALATGLILAQLPRLREGRGWRRVLIEFIDTLLTRSALLRLALLVIAVGVVASRSRMGMLSFLTMITFGASLYLLLRGQGVRWRGLLFILTVLLVDVVLVGGEFGLDELLQRFHHDQLSGDMRLGTFADLQRMLGHYWQVGSGLGSFAYTYPQFRSPEVFAFNDHAHNDYAQFLIETGLPGLSLIALLVLLPAWRGLRVLYQRHDPEILGTALGALLALLCIALHSLTDFNLQIPANAAAVVALLGLLSGLSPQSRSARRKATQDPPAPEPAAG
ncbi:O-Antigen ligase [Solimonas aquatica]|uniref:O-Antigen ligase n=1 Tax=Solimonas aquatica TaxID=489703 RepID=A0A1H9MEQ4_9GAMM|nr:O-antigen ligase family protein [Solimonas aquatica]SER22124.1 O-Antigen ligase [Solimonas aquatica]